MASPGPPSTRPLLTLPSLSPGLLDRITASWQQQPHSPDRRLPGYCRLFATVPRSPTPPPPLDDSLRSLPGGSQIPSSPLARAATRSWRPLSGHQEEPGRGGDSVGRDSE
ncbi:hypothetical protein NN561_015323 [Cricetulus griseus]